MTSSFASLRDLDNSLHNLSRKIAACLSLSCLRNLYDSFPHKELLSTNDLILIKKSSDNYGSRLRSAAISLLLHFSKDKKAHDAHDLINSFFKAGLYQQVVIIVDAYGTLPVDESDKYLLASYLLRDWSRVTQAYDHLNPNTKNNKSFFIYMHSLLEEHSYDLLLSLLSSCAANPEVHSQTNLASLHLATLFRTGTFSAKDFGSFFKLISRSSYHQLALMAPIWSCTESFLSKTELSSCTLHSIAIHYWNLLRAQSPLVDRHYAIPSIAKSKAITRIGFVVDDLTSFRVYESVLSGILATSQDIEEAILVCTDKEENYPDSAIPRVSIYGKSLNSCLYTIRSLALDAIVDLVGPANTSWLLLVAQRVSCIQVYAGAVSPFIAASPLYDAILVDRWTTPCIKYPVVPKLIEMGSISRISDYGIMSNLNVVQAFSPRSHTIVVLGSPDEMLIGSASVCSKIINNHPNVTLFFSHTHWSPRLLNNWWSYWLGTALPARVKCSSTITNLANGTSQIFSISINQICPFQAILECIYNGVPVVYFDTELSGSSLGRSAMNALGLKSFLCNDVTSLYSTVEELINNSELLLDLSSRINSQLVDSVACDSDAYANDILNGLSLLQNTLK